MFSSNKLEISKFVSILGLTYPLPSYLPIKIFIGYKTVIIMEVIIILKSIFMYCIGSVNAFEPHRSHYDNPKQGG